MVKKIDDLTKTRATLTKRWESINKDIQRLSELDQKNPLLSTHARNIIRFYISEFKVLADSKAEAKTFEEIDRLLSSLDYLVKVLSKMSKKRKYLI